MVYNVSILFNSVKITKLVHISLFSGITVILFTLLNIFTNLNISVIILGICMLTVIILLKFVFNHPWLFITEKAARYILETLPSEKMRIDYETNVGNKTKKEIENYKQKMKENIDFFSPMDAQLTIILIIYNIITVFLLCIVFILLITNIIGIFTIYNKYMMSISIIGILLLLIIIIKTFCIYISVNRKLKEINKEFNEEE